MKSVIFFVLCAILATPIFGEESNPDGAIGKFVITLQGGIRGGGGKSSLSTGGYTLKQDADFTGSVFAGEIIYPASKSISLVFTVAGDWQTTKWSETRELLGAKSEFGIYVFTFGIRLFGR